VGLPGVIAVRSHRAFLYLALLAPGLVFHLGSVPSAHARDLAPGEMIQSGLPVQTTVSTARKSDILFSLCRAVKAHPDAAAALTSTAVGARKEFAGEIVAIVLRCSGKSDCEFTKSIVAAAVAAAPDASGAIGEAALARAPACADTIRRAIPPASRAKLNPAAVQSSSPADVAPASGAAEAAVEELDPFEPLRLVCDNGTPRVVRESEIDDFLETHPGAFVGDCPAATPSPSPSPAGEPAVPPNKKPPH
jgi:hypothetical protein